MDRSVLRIGGKTLMALTVEQIYHEAVVLPNLSKMLLVEKLIEDIEANIDKNLETFHIQEAKRRRDEVRSGDVQPILGEEALKNVRDLIE